MIPTKLSAQVFYELPPVLAHFIEQDRNSSAEALPRSGKFYFRDRQGFFVDLTSLIAERRAQIDYLGLERARGLQFVAGFQAGRADATRHMEEFNQNVRLALQAAPVFRQLQGWFVARQGRFEYDLDARTLHREITLTDSLEVTALRELMIDPSICPTACWTTAGYLSGHVSEILQRKVLVIETECAAHGGKRCKFVGKFEPQWGGEADWARKALSGESLAQEFARYEESISSARKAELRARNSLNDINRRLRTDLTLETIVAGDPVMQIVMRRAKQVVGIDIPVLIAGETGVGKEALARALHLAGPRRTKPFEVVDCLGMTSAMITHELFGYEKDGIPGAARAHLGAMARAAGGTVYLNEVSGLSLEAQVMLLRALREGMFYPLGADVPMKVDVRIIAASQNLKEKMDAGEYLKHLYDALSVVVLELPPLRERGDDVLRLAEEFLREFAERYGRGGLTLSRDFKQALLDCTWPGNVRQLRNAVEHAVIMAEGAVLDVAELTDDILAARASRPQVELTEEIVRAALRRTKGNRSQAAELLGIGRTSLWRAMARLKIS